MLLLCYLNAFLVTIDPFIHQTSFCSLPRILLCINSSSFLPMSQQFETVRKAGALLARDCPALHDGLFRKMLSQERNPPSRCLIRLFSFFQAVVIYFGRALLTLFTYTTLLTRPLQSNYARFNLFLSRRAYGCRCCCPASRASRSSFYPEGSHYLQNSRDVRVDFR